MATTERDVLEAKVLPELQAIASSMGVQGYFRLRKADLIGAIIAKARGEEFTPSGSSTTRSRRSATESTPTAESAPTGASTGAAPASSGGEAPAPAAPAPAVSAPVAPAPAAPAPEVSAPAASAPPASAPAAEGTTSTTQSPSSQDSSIQDTAQYTRQDTPTSQATFPRDTAAQGDGQQGAQAPAAQAPSAQGGVAEQPSAPQQPKEQAPEQPSAPAAEQPAAQGGAASSGESAAQDASAAGSGQERPEGSADTTDSAGPTRRRRRRSRGGDDANADQLQGILSAVTSGVAPANQPGENGEAPAAADTQAPADTQADGQREGGQRRDWQQGNRWDSGPGSSSGGSGRSRRSRNRNRNRNRFGGGDVAVADRPDYRDRGGAPDDRPEVSRTGILDIRSQDGYGFLRVNGYLPGPDDVYVPLSMIRRLGLRRGDEVEAMVKLPRDNSDKYAACSRVDKVNGLDPEEARNRTDFKGLTPLYPNERLRLEHNPTEISTRIMDLMSPLGKGQRGLIVSPPKAGKTTVMKQIANAVTQNNPEVYLIILLVGERPEEVTDMQRSTKAEVIFSTFDRPTEDHCQIAELTVERAKRMVEYGRDVMILLDGITRLSRAYNLATPASGKILSGGVDSSALYPPKRFFGAARNLEEGGSLTILATALVDTGSRMDEVIFEEFKGTGNMEVRLDRKLSERRIFPALDIDASSTRKEDLLLDSEELVVAWKLRRVLGALDPAQALELVVDRMRQAKTNAQFLRDIQRANIGGG